MNFKSVVTVITVVVGFSLPVSTYAQDEAEVMLRELATAPDAVEAQRLEERILDEWGKSGSASMDLLYKRGAQALEREDWQAAAEHFRALSDHAPDFSEAWHGLALVSYNQGRYGPAMEALERTLALQPNHFPALRGVGAINEQTGRYELAYRAYQRVLELRPHDADIIEALERLSARIDGTLL